METKTKNKIPFGLPSVGLALILGLVCISLSPEVNSNGGFDWLPRWFLVISNTVGIIFLVLAVLILIYSFYVERQLKRKDDQRNGKY